MKRELTIGLDVDGVLRNLFRPLIDLYNREYNDTVDYDSIDYWSFETWSPKLYRERGEEGCFDFFFKEHSSEMFFDAPIMDNTIPDAVRRLRKYGKVYIMTFQKYPQNKIDTIKWLEKYGIEYDGMLFSDTKTEIRTDIMIDDRIGYINNNRPEISGILIRTPFNQNDEEMVKWGINVDVYDSINEFVDNIEKYIGNNGN